MENREQLSAQEAAEALAAALQKKLEERPHLENVIRAFGTTLIEQARWKAELDGHDLFQVSAPNPDLYAKGVPVSDREQLIQLGELWITAAHRIIPSLREGFPLLAEGLALLWSAIVNGNFSADLFMSALCGGRAGEARAASVGIGFDPEALLFVLTTLARPVVSRRSELLMAQVQDLPWNRGYCPICGSFPELSLLREKEGQRRLQCGFCSASWRFSRISCPLCDARDIPGDTELLFVEGREEERIEACNQCRRYVPGVDLRGFSDVPPLEVLNISLIPLEAIARRKGFLPLKDLGWEIPGSL